VSVVTRWPNPVGERTSLKVSGSFVDLDGDGFKPTALTATVYDAATGAAIRSRGSVLDVNGGTVGAGGEFVLELAPADNAIVGSRRTERHILLLEWTWDGGAKAGRHEIHFSVQNFDRVPSAFALDAEPGAYAVVGAAATP
jgi:hypothetical protein